MTDNIFNRIEIEIKRTYYTFDRYKADATFALIYHKEPLSIEELGSFVRISDKFVKIDDNHYFINFAFTTQEGTFKACQNLLMGMDNFFGSNTTCIAIDNFDTSKKPAMVYNRLMQILKEIQRSSYSRIEDENILNMI
ncbi:hypothetical protein N9A28_08200 [Sulfurimonas sp.]|nr:hypothetical protein [Sulfurimonas sp.]